MTDVFAIHENQQAEINLSTVAYSLVVGGGRPGQGYPLVMIEQPKSFDELNNSTGDVHHPIRTGAESTGVAHEVPYTAFDSWYSGRYDIPDSGDLSPTVKALGGPPAIGTLWTVRRLTPLECERLMGWADNYTLNGIADDGTPMELKNTHRYRICGNGIVANVTQWIGERLP